MGRNAQPIDLLVANGKKHLTKAEIDFRKKSEIKIGDNKLKCPDFVKNDLIAYKKWKEILKVYKDIDFVSSGDIGLLARYCMSFSEYENLLTIRKNIGSLTFDPEDELDTDEVLSEVMTERRKQQLFKKINYILSTDGLLTMETAINRKMDMLIKMEDRLFLNPLAKIKNVPKAPEENPKENKFGKFQKGGTG